MGEHGPHAVALGPDGLLYLLVGNFSRTDRELAPTSPYHDFYEGDLITPRYEDASGHAVGIKAPGGRILRTDTRRQDRSSCSPAACRTPTTWPSTTKASCSPATPTWSGTRACPGIGPRA